MVTTDTRINTETVLTVEDVFHDPLGNG